MLRHSLLLCGLLAAVAAHGVTYNCGGKAGRSGPCDKQDASCELECQTSEYCQRKKGDSYFCNQAGARGGCCELMPRWDTRKFDCSTRECNSHAYCMGWKRGSHCINGCCRAGRQHFVSWRGAFHEYTCNKQQSFMPCSRKMCQQECQTTQHCQKINGPGSFCHAQTGCCTADTAYGKELTCETIECNSHDACSGQYPGTHCANGCCTVNVDPIPEEIVSPGFGREGREVTYCKDLHADIVLVIDASGSITAPIFNTHTKRFAKSIIERFDVGATRTRIGLVVYSATVYYTLPLTECTDVACLLSAIDALSYAAGGTCTGDGIAAATTMLLKSQPLRGETSRSRAIIVITDGNEECGYGPSTVPKRCNEARGQDIDLYAVAVGTKTFYTKAAAIADLDAICGGDSDKRFVVENYEALDKVFVERLQRQVCSTTWQVYGRCAKTECYTDSFCGKSQRGTVCRGGCCVDSKIELPDPIITNECTFLAADVILVIDGSGSITAPIFNTHTKTFVKELISRFTIGFSRTRVGIVAYSSSVYYTVSLEECADSGCLLDKIDALSYPSGGTCTGNAIATATGMFELATNDGVDRPKVVIVITDGHEECGGGASTVPKRCDEARTAGVDLFAVAVGTDTFLKKPAAVADLKAISNNDDSRQFIAQDYASLDYSFVDNLQREVCTTTAITTIEGGETCEVECRSTAFCKRKDKFTECSNGCCVPSWRDWDDRKIIRPPRAITYCYGLHADIVLVIDASGSITAPIFNAQTKMFAKSLVARFDVGPLKTRVGIVAYAASVYYTQDVTECYDVNCLYAKIDQLSYPAGGTCTGNAIAKATEILSAATTPNFYERNRARVIIVITDGHEECGGGASTVPARCNAARDDDIELYAVAVGDTFRNKPAAIADLNAIANNEENNKFLANDYNALDSTFVERIQREVCSTEFRRWGREGCENECRTDAYCGRVQAGSVCRRGCCVGAEVIIPVQPIFVAECKYVNADVVLVIDASGSITAPIFNTHTKNFAKELIDRFVVSTTRTRIGLVAYAASVYSTYGLTACADGACLKNKIDSLNYPAGGTCTGDAIAKATELLLAAPSPDGQDRPKVIIVITDGNEECGRGASTVPRQCDAARASGIDLFAVAVGTDTFLTKPAAIADLNAICNNRDDHKFIAQDYASLDYAFVDDLQREVCSSTVKEGLDEDCKAECTSHVQCAYFASGTKCVNGCCKVPVEPGTGGGGGSTCSDQKPASWCKGMKAQCSRQMSMRTACARTCGFCDGAVVEPKPKCVDKKSASWCKSNLGNCKKGPYQAKMRCGCAATCGFCSTDGGPPPPQPQPTGPCFDATADCGLKSALCNNYAYKSLMLEKCPKTCGWCGAPPLVTSPPLILPPITTAPVVVSTRCGNQEMLLFDGSESLLVSNGQYTLIITTPTFTNGRYELVCPSDCGIGYVSAANAFIFDETLRISCESSGWWSRWSSNSFGSRYEPRKVGCFRRASSRAPRCGNEEMLLYDGSESILISNPGYVLVPTMPTYTNGRLELVCPSDCGIAYAVENFYFDTTLRITCDNGVWWAKSATNARGYHLSPVKVGCFRKTASPTFCGKDELFLFDGSESLVIAQKSYTLMPAIPTFVSGRYELVCPSQCGIGYETREKGFVYDDTLRITCADIGWWLKHGANAGYHYEPRKVGCFQKSVSPTICGTTELDLFDGSESILVANPGYQFVSTIPSMLNGKMQLRCPSDCGLGWAFEEFYFDTRNWMSCESDGWWSKSEGSNGARYSRSKIGCFRKISVSTTTCGTQEVLLFDGSESLLTQFPAWTLVATNPTFVNGRYELVCPSQCGIGYETRGGTFSYDDTLRITCREGGWWSSSQGFSGGRYEPRKVGCFKKTVVATTVAPVSTCVDTATDCGWKSGLCNNRAYKSLMMRRCKHTCGWC